MYFLNDKHPKYEFAMYKQVKSAEPYIHVLNWINNMNDLLSYIAEIEKKHNHYHQVFYIDNEFYENQYSINQNGTYYKFLFRRINDWEVFEDFKELKEVA